MNQILENTILSIFIVINLISFFLFFIDKRKAIKGSERIPEKNFFYLSLAGGWILGIIGIYLFRHKNKKFTFMSKYILAAVPSISLEIFGIIYNYNLYT